MIGGPSTLLSSENYTQGFLIDNEWMAGVSEMTDPDARTQQYLAYVVDLVTQSTVGAHRFSTLGEALDAIARIRSSWEFVPTTRCGQPGGCGGNCGSSCKKQCESE